MPPKKKKVGGKKGGKGKKGKKGKKKTVEPLPEEDKSFYELQITGLNRILSELRSRQIVNEELNEQLLKAQQDLRGDEVDIISYLNRTIDERNEEIAQLQVDFDAIEKARSKALEEFEDKKQELMNHYRLIEEVLISDQKLIVGKTHALEEFRLQRDELMKKYEILENAMEDQKVRHKREIYDVERKFIIGKDKLKKEMDAKLKWLIDQFQSVTDLRVAATTLKVIKENIALNNKLEEMLHKLRKLYERHESLSVHDSRLKLLSQMTSYEASTIANKAHNMLGIIVKLINEYYSMNKVAAKAKKVEPVMIELGKSKKHFESLITEYTTKHRIIEQNLHEVRCKREEFTSEIRYVEGRNEELTAMLQQAVQMLHSSTITEDVYTIQSSPEAQAPEFETEIIEEISKSTMLYKLYEFFKQIREWVRKPGTIEKLESRDDIYMKGKLGLVPRDVILKSMIPTRTNEAVQASGSYHDLFYQPESECFDEMIEPEESDLSDMTPFFVEQEVQTDDTTTSTTTSSTSTSESNRSPSVDEPEEDTV